MVVEENLRKEVLNLGTALKDKCRESRVNCAIFLEFPEESSEVSGTEIVRMTIHNIYSLDGAISPVLGSIMDTYNEALTESEDLKISNTSAVPLFTNRGLKDN
jgi:hypothetical protein